MSTVKTTCMVTLIIIGAQILSAALTYSGVSRAVSEWILALGLPKWVFFLALVVLYMVLGCFVDGISMIYMTLPVLLPVIKAFNFDIVWFGIILTILIELGQITPPVGLNLFTIHAISGGLQFLGRGQGIVPLLLLDAVRDPAPVHLPADRIVAAKYHPGVRRGDYGASAGI